MDTLAPMISGLWALPEKRASACIRLRGGVKEATVIGTRPLTPCVNAAFANGMMAHADETDGSHPRTQAHPRCGVLAAALDYDISVRDAVPAEPVGVARRSPAAGQRFLPTL